MKRERDYEPERSDTISEKLEHFVDSYLRGILLLGGIITVGFGSMFFGDKVIGVGTIVLLCGLFYHSFGGLIRRFLYLALAAIALVGATAHLGISTLAAHVQEKLSDTRTKTMENAYRADKAKATPEVCENTADEVAEPVFKRVVLDGDVEQEAGTANDVAEAAFSAPVKPKFVGGKPLAAATAGVSSHDDEEEILRAGIDKDDEIFGVMETQTESFVQTNMCEEIPTGFIPDEDIPDENLPPEEILDDVVFAHEEPEETVSRMRIRPRKVRTNRLSNGTRIIFRAASDD